VKISSLRASFHSQLATLYQKQEIDAIFYIYIYEKYKIFKHQYFLNPEKCIVIEEKDIEELSKGCPIQYVIGKTTFYDLELNVNPSVLIPRPETEELVEHILKSTSYLTTFAMSPSFNFEEMPAKSGQGSFTKILDLGTGSGAIAIALVKNLNNATAWATDISKKALETARQNAVNNNVEINFLHHDLLKDDFKNLPDKLDIIVSNPPYIPQSERVLLHTNIVDYEPNEALFVPDTNPFIYYDAIAAIAQKNLRKGGSLYLEIHEEFHTALTALLLEQDFKDIILWNDINGKPRFVGCKKL